MAMNKEALKKREGDYEERKVLWDVFYQSYEGGEN